MDIPVGVQDKNKNIQNLRRKPRTIPLKLVGVLSPPKTLRHREKVAIHIFQRKNQEWLMYCLVKYGKMVG